MIHQGTHPTQGRPVALAALLGEFDAGAVSAGPSRRTAVATGFEPLDRVLAGGVRMHDLVVVGGRPGVGKTVACLQWARNMAAAGSRVVYACYEHDEHTLLARLVALEIGNLRIGSHSASALESAAVIREVMAGRWALASPVGRHPVVRAARSQIEQYGDRLVLVSASPSSTGAKELADFVDQYDDDVAVLFVDHAVMMRPENELASRADQIAESMTSLKELALAHDVGVVTICGASSAAMPLRRLHLDHLEEPAAVGYEADVVVLMNDKSLAIARSHLTYDTAQTERLARQVVFSVEKNRGGPSLVDLEFEKDFLHYRFNPVGSYVQERLVDRSERE